MGSIVSDKVLPVLGTVPIKKEMKSSRAEAYVPVRGTLVNSINIFITDEQGSQHSFELGQVLCELHFKQQQHQQQHEV